MDTAAYMFVHCITNKYCIMIMSILYYDHLFNTKMLWMCVGTQGDHCGNNFENPVEQKDLI